MMCVSLGEKTFKDTKIAIKKAILLGADLVEIRLDKLNAREQSKITTSKLKDVFNTKLRINNKTSKVDVLITSHESHHQNINPKKSNDGKCNDNNLTWKNKMLISVDAKAKYIDIDFRKNRKEILDLIKCAKKKGCKIIVSYHNYKRTPKDSELKKIITKCKLLNPNYIKIACTVNKLEDHLTITNLVGRKIGTAKIITIGMGKTSKITRIIGATLGNPINYVSLKKGKETALGQIDITTMKKLLGKLN